MGHSIADRFLAARLAACISVAASILAKGIKEKTVALLDGIDIDIAREALEVSPDTALINDLVAVMASAASAHLESMKP